MARRSFGVVLIVALLGWTVNQPIMGCEGQHSRAAVVVLAGASPAYQPEPSPTRHSCCPRENRPATQPSSSSHPCHHQFSSHHDCCSLAGNTPDPIPLAVLTPTSSPDFALAPAVAIGLLTPETRARFAVAATSSGGTGSPSFIVLRL